MWVGVDPPWAGSRGWVGGWVGGGLMETGPTSMEM